jgi:hypothetical protein
MLRSQWMQKLECAWLCMSSFLQPYPTKSRVLTFFLSYMCINMTIAFCVSKIFESFVFYKKYSGQKDFRTLSCLGKI